MPRCLKALSISHFRVSYHAESGASLTGEAMDPFVLWELFQCQTPVLSVFCDAESWSVLVTDEETSPSIEGYKFVRITEKTSFRVPVNRIVSRKTAFFCHMHHSHGV